MSNPPPLPENPKKVQRAVFKKTIAFRLGEITLDYGLIEQSHALAEAWINQNPEIEVINIETYHSSALAVTVVWFRS